MLDKEFESWGLTEKILGKPVFYVSDVTGNKYLVEEYANHGRGGEAYCKNLGWRKDLPHDEYPYSTECRYEENPLSATPSPENYPDYERRYIRDEINSTEEDEINSTEEKEVMGWFFVPVK